jgi:hypothetical protein
VEAGLGQALFDDGRGGLLVGFAGEEIEVRHAFADVLGVGAGMHGGGSFDGNRWEERAVNDGFGETVAFPGPVVDVNAGVLPLGKTRRENFGKEVGGFGCVGASGVAFKDGGVPKGVKIWHERVVHFMGTAAEIADWNAIAALVVVSGGVEWHVQMVNCSAMALVTQPSAPQYGSIAPRGAPRGMLM